MSKIDITSIFKNLSKNELINVISIAQEILSDLFSHDEIKD
ncbi:IS1595 family transposase, partial [Clostridium perfringens]|nr:IS1595 family transposase [Clostridium perfringens]